MLKLTIFYAKVSFSAEMPCLWVCLHLAFYCIKKNIFHLKIVATGLTFSEETPRWGREFEISSHRVVILLLLYQKNTQERPSKDGPKKIILELCNIAQKRSVFLQQISICSFSCKKSLVLGGWMGVWK